MEQSCGDSEFDSQQEFSFVVSLLGPRGVMAFLHFRL